MNAKVGTGPDRARSLEIFAAVMREGSFSAAGRALGLTPSAVARSIDRIEARLGVRLLLRSTRALTLTAEGQAYLQTARRILADLDDAERQLADQGPRAADCGLVRRYRMGGSVSCRCSARSPRCTRISWSTLR